MEIKKTHWIGIGVAAAIIIISLFLIGTRFFFFVFGMGIVIAIAPFVFSMINETRTSAEKEEMFLEFSRNLVESVKAGIPISKSIINIKDKPYGKLSGHIKKLGNQISMGIPMSMALQVFSKDVGNKTISRAIVLIGQAEKAGGNIEEILQAVAGAVSMSDKLKKERMASINTLVVQGYIIFFVFIIIVLVMQFKIVPIVSGISDFGAIEGIGISISGTAIEPGEISNAFLYLLLIQGFFSGLVMGKLSTGDIKAGIRHSFTLMLMSFLISAGANVFFG